MSIHQKQIGVVLNWLALLIANISGRSADQHAETLGEAICPIWLLHLCAVGIEPSNVFYIGSANSFPSKIFRSSKDGMISPELGELASEFKESFLFRSPVPIEPGYFVVLAISVVVAKLRSTELVAGIDHRHS